jgi:hypothetical protein
MESSLSWVEDGKDLWNTFKDFARAFLAIYFSSSEQVSQDIEIQEFWDMVNTLPAGPASLSPEEKKEWGYKLPPLNSGAGALENLIDYLAHMIFGVCADHEVYGAVGEYFTTPMGLSTKIFNERYEPNDMDPCGQSMQEVQTFLQALVVISGTGVPMPKLIADWARLTYVQDDDLNNWDNKVEFDAGQVATLRDYLRITGEKPAGWQPSTMGYSGVSVDKPGYEVSKSVLVSQTNTIASVEELLKQDRAKLDQILVAGRKLDNRRLETDTLSEHEYILKKVNQAFMESLIRLSDKMRDRNKLRKQIYTAYDPANLECSVNI